MRVPAQNPKKPRKIATSPATYNLLQPKLWKPDQTAQSASNTQEQSVNSPLGHKSVAFNFENIAVVQPKLTIGEPNDRLEQEADQVADEVVQRINSGQPINQGEDAPPNRSIRPTENLLAMRSPLQCQGGIVSGPTSDQFEIQLNQTRAGGSPLAPKIRSQMEAAMGADFSTVKIHTDSPSDQLSRSIQAKAFTTGNDIFFRQGAYSPDSRGGQALLAHELTHVVQQGHGALQRTLSRKATLFKNDALVKQRVNVATSPSPVADMPAKGQQPRDTIQRKTQNLTSISTDQLPNKKFSIESKQYVIRTNVEKYNKLENVYYKDKKDLKLLEAIQDKSVGWLEKYNERDKKVKNDYGTEVQKKVVERVLAEANGEITLVHHQASQEEATASGNSPIKEKIGKTKEIISETSDGYKEFEGDVKSISSDTKDALTILNGGAEAVEKLQDESIKSSSISGLRDASKESRFSSQSLEGMLEKAAAFEEKINDFISGSSIISGALKSLPILGDIIDIIKGCKDAKGIYQQYASLIEAKEFENPGKTEEKGSFKDAIKHGYGKVKRKFWGKIGDIAASFVKAVCSLISLLSGGTAAVVTELIKLGTSIAKTIGSIVRKIKGLIKLLLGKRAKHRQQSAEAIVKEAHAGDELACKLVTESIPSTTVYDLINRKDPCNASDWKFAEGSIAKYKALSNALSNDNTKQEITNSLKEALKSQV